MADEPQREGDLESNPLSESTPAPTVEPTALGETVEEEEEYPAVQPVSALVVVDDDVVGRIGGAIRHLCVGMIDEAVRLNVVSFARAADAAEVFGPSRVTEMPRRFWPWSLTSSAEGLRLVGEKPTVIHCGSAALARRVFHWAIDWRCTLLVHLTDLEDVRQLAGVITAPKLHLLTNTTVVARAVEQLYPQLQDKITIVPLGVPAAGEPACFARTDRIPSAITTVPLAKDSGLDVALTAFQKVCKAGHDIHLFLLSSGRGETRWRRMLNELDLKSRVTIAGEFRNPQDLQAAMAASDFFVLPAPRYRFSLDTLTAMAHGLTVLAPTDTVEDYLIDQETALLFQSGRAKELAQKWSGLLEDRSAARDLAHAALDYVLTHHKASAMVARVAALYRKLTRGPAASG